MPLMPRKPVPALEFDLVGGGRWSLATQQPKNFTMVVFYRGLHCPICHRYTSELNGMIADFDKRGVSIDKAREWGAAGPPDPNPNPACTLVVNGFAELADKLGT